MPAQKAGVLTFQHPANANSHFLLPFLIGMTARATAYAAISGE